MADPEFDPGRTDHKKWAKWIAFWVVGTLVGHIIWPFSEKLGEDALFHWINERIAERYGIVGPSTEQVIEFAASWSIPGLVAACALFAIYAAYRVGRGEMVARPRPSSLGHADEPRRRIEPALGRATSTQAWVPIANAIEHVSESIGDSAKAECFPDARQAIREAAYDGRILLRGRQQLPSRGNFRSRDAYSNLSTDIESNYWRNSVLNAYSTSPYQRLDYHTEPESLDAWGPLGPDERKHYADLAVREADLLRQWPKP